MAMVTGQFADKRTCGQSSRGLIDSRTSQVAETFDLNLKLAVNNSYTHDLWEITLRNVFNSRHG